MFIFLGENPISIDWSILYYLLNFVLLFAGLYWLLFKPVKKFMTKRNEEIIRVSEENKTLSLEVAEAKSTYDNLMIEAKEEFARASERAKVISMQKAEEIISDAKSQAQSIIENSKNEIENEKKRIENELKSQVEAQSKAIAEKILKKTLDEKTCSDIISECLSDWEKQ